MLLERTLVRGLVCLLATVAAVRAPAANDAESRRPLNVLMIAVDDLRPDIGCYGSRIAKTPHMDRLAARGVVFGHAYCQQAVCSPSRTSLMTGQRPDITRVLDLKTHFRTALPDCVTLPQHFKANGYHCAALNKIYHRGYEDGRSWSEPHWYPNGKTVDADPNDWTKQTTKKVGGGVEEYSADTPRAESVKGPATVVSDKSYDELPDGYTAAEAHVHADDLGDSFSDEMIERMHVKLGRPARCPHGWPVETTFEQEENRELTPLSALAAGDTAEIVRLAEHDGDLLHWFYESGLAPGTRVEVETAQPGGGATVRIAAGALQLDERSAAGLYVRRAA